ncbi:MAG: PKD domain-containing protein [Sphingobacteriia bacterium]|nr:PKD domain-containing protein [Sphingobacteriia bacterium]
MKNLCQYSNRCILLTAALLYSLFSYGYPISHSSLENTNAVVASFTVNTPMQCLDGNYFILTNNSTNGPGITYFWDFGDGTSTTEANPVKIYSRTGNFRIHLEVRSGNDFAFVERFIDVKPKPVVDFNILTQTLDGHAFTFISSSKIENGAMNYFWDLGDGTISTLINPTHNYSVEEATHTVKLVVTSEIGCGDSIIKVINYRPETKCALPNASFVMDGNFQCNPKNNIFQFNNLSSIDIGTQSFAWAFGDGTTATTVNPSKHYTNKGVYTISLKATNNNINACNTTVIKTVKISGVESGFTNNPVAPQCLNGNRTNFTNTTNSDYAKTNYTWRFGDGASSTETNTAHSYNAAGNFSVNLIASVEGLNCVDTSNIKTVTIWGSPKANITVTPASLCNNKTFSFKDTANNSSVVIATYAWNFGDGSMAQDINPSHTYAAYGPKTVRLLLTTDHGCTDSASQSVKTNEVVAAFTLGSVAQQCAAGNRFVFTNASHTESPALNYSWSFGDGGSSSATNTSYSFASNGTYTVKLIARVTGMDCTDSTTQTVTVWKMPKANFAVNPASACNNKTFAFKDTANNSGVNILTYAWSFGDGTSASVAEPSHTYTTFGTKTVQLLVVSDKGCKDSVVQTVATNQTVAAFNYLSAIAQCLKGNRFLLSNTSFSESASLSYNWNFGDGQISTQLNPDHVYATAGNYTIRLIAKVNGTDCADTIAKAVSVYANPQAAINANTIGNCNNRSFRFTSGNNSSDLIYGWNFGDGTGSYEANPSHSYTNFGSNTVTLIVTNSNGCKDTAVQTITTQQIQASFAVNPSSIQCVKNNQFSFVNTSTASGSNAMLYSWSLGENDQATTVNVNKSFKQAGSYAVRLIAKIPSNGCADTVTRNVTVYPNVSEIKFSSHLSNYTNTTITVNFENESEIENGSLSYTWDFGDGQTSSVKNPTHVYQSNSATRIVKLVTISNRGCADTLSKLISLVDGQSHERGDKNSSNSNTGNNNTPATDSRMDIYPNPAQNAVQLNIRNQQNVIPNGEMYTVRVVDFNGHIAIQKTQPAAMGVNTVFNINIQNLVPGNYFVEVLNAQGAKIASHILIKSR